MSMSLGLNIAITGQSGGGGGSASLPDFTFQAETDALNVSRTAAGIPMTRRQKLAFDRMVVRVKAAGVSVTDWAALYVPSTPTETQARVNQIHPGTNDLTLTGAGTPTYTANDRWSGWLSTAKYNTGIGLQSFTQGQFTIFYYSRTATGGSSGEFGAQTAGGDGIAANTKDASSKFNARLQAANYVSTSTTITPGQGMHSIRPNSLDTFGITREAPAPTYVSPATNPTIHLGGINGGALSTKDCGLFAIFKVTLTDAQTREVSAALLDYYYKVRFGMVDYYEAGKAPTTADYDVVVYGASWTGVCAAYAAKQEGKSVCMVLDDLAKTDWDIGGMPASGLAYVDCYNFTALKGLYRDLTSWANSTIINRADTNTQTGNSIESWQFVQGVRRMLDPTRTNGTLILGQDIPVYFSTGIASITSVGLKDTALITNDGRTFTARQFIAADYDGEYIHKSSGIPTFTGSEAAGSGSEANNGYKGSSALSKPYGSDISPYITDGVPASGLLPDIQGEMPLPGLTVDGVDPSIQSMNYRLAMTGDPARLVPVTTMDPHRNYNALRNETAARAYVLNPSVTIGNPAVTTTILQFAVGGSTNKMDVNNGSGGLSTDLPGSGYRYATAANRAAQLAVIDDLRDYQLGWFWWHANSGDSRIPSTLVTQFQGFGLDAGTFLDPGPGGLLFWPNRPYQRDPIWRLKNAGYVSTAQDYCKTDGTALRSDKTVAVTSYDCDKHPPWKVASGGLLYTQGSVPGSLVAGADKIAPIPLEEIVPDVTVKTNVIVPWASSQTILCWYMGRLEPTGGLKGEAAGVIASMAIDGTVNVQDVDYSTLRTKLLARDVNHPILPQVA
ncbi:FAD-dependent oxidoreductase [Rhizobium leguminosarum]